MILRPAVPDDAMPVARVHVRAWQAAYRGLMPEDYLAGAAPGGAGTTLRLRRSGSGPTQNVGGGRSGYGPRLRHDLTGSRCGRSRSGRALRAVCRARLLGPWNRTGARSGRARRPLPRWNSGRQCSGWSRAILARERFYRADGWSRDGLHRPRQIWNITVDTVRYSRALVRGARLFRRVVLDDRSLVKHDLPSPGRAPPDRRPPRLAWPLRQRIRQQVSVASQLPAGEVGCFPRVFQREMACDLMAILQHIENALTAVAAAGGADLPEILRGHALEIRPGSAKLRAMEDRLAAAQILQDFPQPRLGAQPRFASAVSAPRTAGRLAPSKLVPDNFVTLVTSTLLSGVGRRRLPNPAPPGSATRR